MLSSFNNKKTKSRFLSGKKNFFFLYFTFIFSFPGNAQKETYNWHFANNSHISFVTGSPVLLTGCQIYNSFQQEGTSSMSDAIGNTLFYSDGVTVWNSMDSVMPNGTGLTGNNSTTQSALIVPKPGSVSEYFLFTLTSLAGTHELSYSIVDMTLAGGLGDVAVKNVLVADSMTEKQIAVRHSNGSDFWLITHKDLSNEFESYLINASGVAATPVISAAGWVITGTFGTVGGLKASLSGNKIAAAYWHNNVFELYDFNNSTGFVSNPVTIQNSLYNEAYAVEFSPDGHFLYGSCYNANKIYQFDAQSAAPVGVLVGPAGHHAGEMLLGPDGRIYISLNSSNYLGVINAPNSAGTACNFIENGFSLDTNHSLIGLPNMVHDLITLVSVETILAETSFTIYPNPASDQFTISSGQLTINKIEIFNLPGETVFTEKPQTLNFKLQTLNLPNGIYIIRAYTEEGIFQQKLVVNH
jgi:hypothetical protein